MTDRRVLLDEIIEYSSLPPLAEDEFTVAQYLERCQERGRPVIENTAYGRLNRLIARGVLAKRKVVHKGKECNAYRIVNRGEGGG